MSWLWASFPCWMSLSRTSRGDQVVPSSPSPPPSRRDTSQALRDRKRQAALGRASSNRASYGGAASLGGVEERGPRPGLPAPSPCSGRPPPAMGVNPGGRHQARGWPARTDEALAGEPWWRLWWEAWREDREWYSEELEKEPSGPVWEAVSFRISSVMESGGRYGRM